MKITREEMEVLRKYIPDVDAIVKSGDVPEFELTLDRAIIENGLDKNDEITKVGVMLQGIYDKIFDRNG